MPFITIGRPEAALIQGISDQERVRSMNWAIRRPMPPPFLSLVAVSPLGL